MPRKRQHDFRERIRQAAMLETARSLPQRRVETQMRNPRGVSERSFAGCSLFDYAVKTGMIQRATSIGGLGNYYFVAEGEDGFKVAIAFAEVNPRLHVQAGAAGLRAGRRAHSQRPAAGSARATTSAAARCSALPASGWSASTSRRRRWRRIRSCK